MVTWILYWRFRLIMRQEQLLPPSSRHTYYTDYPHIITGTKQPHSSKCEWTERWTLTEFLQYHCVWKNCSFDTKAAKPNRKILQLLLSVFKEAHLVLVLCINNQKGPNWYAGDAESFWVVIRVNGSAAWSIYLNISTENKLSFNRDFSPASVHYFTL